MDWKEIERVVKENERESNYVEAMELGGVILPLIKLKEYDLFLWGIGADFDTIFLYLKASDIVIKGIICPDKEREFYEGIPVMLPDELKKQGKEKMFVIITDPDCFNDDRFRGVVGYASWLYNAIKIRAAVRKYNPIVRKYKQTKIIKALEKQGVQDYYFLKKREYKEIRVSNSTISYNEISYYKSHLNELKKTYDMLYDRISKEVMIEYMLVNLQRGLYRGKECDGRNKYFAGYGRGEKRELLYEHKKDEVWVNCGASVGDNILLYLADGYRAKRIYAFEGSKTVYEALCKNIARLPEELRKMVIPVNKFISEGTSWNSDIKEKITLINADIEGYELELLHSMKNIIRTDRPVIAICAYHRKEDLVELPCFIEETVNDYKFLLRKYTTSIYDAMRTYELVLYAIPQERLYINKL